MQYAHDTSLHCCGNDLAVVQEQFQQQDSDRIQSWMQSDRLHLNVSKSALIMIGSHHEVEG